MLSNPVTCPRSSAVHFYRPTHTGTQDHKVRRGPNKSSQNYFISDLECLKDVHILEKENFNCSAEACFQLSVNSGMSWGDNGLTAALWSRAWGC